MRSICPNDFALILFTTSALMFSLSLFFSMYSEEIKLLDNWRNFEKYMSKWLCIDFIHSWRITPLQHWCFHCCCFFIVFRRNLFIFLGCSPSPSHPCHFPPLLFKLKIVNPFQTCQWTDTFVKYSLLLPFFSKKGKQHKEDNINIIFLGFQNKPSLEDTGVPAYM